MDWLIWVIVIVLIVAIVWWLTSRNNARNSPTATASEAGSSGTPGQPGTPPPAATEPSDTMSMPDTAAAVTGVAGLAGVTNLGKAAAEGSGPTEEEARREEDPGDVDASARPAVDDSATATGETAPVREAEPSVEEPVIETPVVDEPVVGEPVVDSEAASGGGDVDDWETASPVKTPAAAVSEATEGVTADDVTRADDAHGARDVSSADAAADKAEWESSWTDASGAPVHHHEYTDAHAVTLAGAETAAAEMAEEEVAAPSGHLAADHPYGVGSAGAAADGSVPDGYSVKADATTMTYHDEDTPGYAEAPADVWFESAAHAEAAGFRPPRRNRH